MLEVFNLTTNPRTFLAGLYKDCREDDYEWDDKLGEERQVVKSLRQMWGLVIFSDKVPARGRSNGMRLRDFILQHDLGEISSSPIAKNPNSGNNIQGYIWAPNVNFDRMFGPKTPSTRKAKG